MSEETQRRAARVREAGSGESEAGLRRLSVIEALRLAAQRQRRGELDQAERLCRRILAAVPDQPGSLFRLASIAHRRGRTGEAARLLSRVVEIRPGWAEAHYALGLALKDAGRLDEGVEALQRAIALRPAHAGARHRLGTALAALGRLDESVAAFREATARAPNHAAAHYDLGRALKGLGRVEEAEGALRRAVEIRPAWAAAHTSLAESLLLLGKLGEGWRENEWRWRTRGRRPRAFGCPSWRGEPFPGKTLLIDDEQGSGNVIQFVRFAPLAAARGGRVVLLCRPQLARLFRSLEGVDQVVTRGEPLPAYDLHATVMSVPGLLGIELDGLPAEVPYLAPEPEVAASWRERVGDDGRLRVGFAWAGNPLQGNDRNRSMPLERLAPLLGAEGVRFYSIQVGKREPDLERLPRGAVTNLAPGLTDYAETAGAIAALDLVVTVDTAVGHLAGALAKPVWVMLAFIPSWRYFLEREDSPWYPAMRLFRQERAGAWEPVVARVKAELEACAAGDRARLVPGSSAGA
jgi:tetratricopeptide (TPR) repeat protein